MPRYAPELRSLRGPIRGAPPIRMGGPTEQYERSRGQQKSFGLGQLYPQQQPQITGWQPGPLQTDPIRRVDRDPAKRGLTLAGEREEEGRRLRQRGEIAEEFAAPPREQARRDRLRREFIAEQEQADKDALEARQREEKQRQESVKRGGLAQILQPLYVESGMSPQEANIAATQAVTSNKAEDEIDRLNRQKADLEEARIKQQTAEAKRAEEELGRESVRKLVPARLGEAIRPGGLTGAGALVEAGRQRTLAKPRVSPEAQAYRTESARDLRRAEIKEGMSNPGVPYNAIKSFQSKDQHEQSVAIANFEAQGKTQQAMYLRWLMKRAGVTPTEAQGENEPIPPPQRSMFDPAGWIGR